MRFQYRVCDNMDGSVLRTSYYLFRPRSGGPLSACGDLTMAPQSVVVEQMGLWTQYVQRGLQTLASDPGRVDIVAFASKIQQWFVVVHPFVDGKRSHQPTYDGSSLHSIWASGSNLR